jgi:hypothetical protein
MTSLATKIHLPVPASQVWQVIGGFNALPDWHPGIEKSELEDGGTVRRLTVPGAGTVVERLENLDDNARSYSYTIVEGPLPVADYAATIRVVEDDDGKGCTVEWTSDFEPTGPEADALAVIRGVFEAGLKNLEAMFGRS